MEKEGDVPLVNETSDVFHEGEPVGHVEISLTSSYYKEASRQLLWSSSFTIIITLLSLIIMIGFLLPIFLRKPLKDLGEIVNSYASGKYDSSGHHMSFLEFQPFVAVLGEMGDKIKSQMTELRNAEKKYRSIFENAVEGIFQSTPEGRFISTNPAMAHILGYDSPEEALAAYSDIQNQLHFHLQDRENFLVLLGEKGRITGFETQIYRKDASMIWISVSARIVRDAEGKVLYYEGTVEDITERKKAEEALQRAYDELEVKMAERTAELAVAKERAEAADRLKSAFLASMSHELRTPLNSIIGFTGIILQELAGPLNDEQTKQLNMVRNSSRHLLDLINDVLDISKIEAGQLEITSEPFDMREAIEKVVRTVTPLAEKKGLALVAEVAPQVGQITSDRRRVEQILINLTNNAIKFTEEGVVCVECEVNDSWLVTRVVDTGIGIKPEDVGKLFKAFQQVDTGLARVKEGTGLGLSICKKLLEMLGGEIWVESEWGVGSTFTFTLPSGVSLRGTLR